MPGVPGSGGPPPKRSSQRRRRNKPEVEIDTVEAVGKVRIPPSKRDWHPVAKQWYLALRGSGQSQFYESSDWATAYLIAESMSRELHPQPVVVGRGDDAETVLVSLPPKGASLAAWLRAMTSLMVTEGDRRRARLELERAEVEEGDADVSELAEYRRRLEQSR